MTSRARQLIKRLLPPLLVDLMRGRALFPHTYTTYTWEGIYPHLRDVPTKNGTYDDKCRITEMTEQARAFWAAVQAGQPLYLWHEMMGLLAATVSARRDRVCVLDFGGGMGTGFIQLLATLCGNTTLEYHVVDLEKMCAAGRRLFDGDSRIEFHTALPSFPRGVDIVYVNSVLQYLDDYAGMLRTLAALNAPYLLFARLTAGKILTFATRQLNLPGQVLPHWFLNLDEVVGILRVAGYALVYNGVADREYDQSNFPESHRLGRMRNLLFVRATATTDSAT